MGIRNGAVRHQKINVRSSASRADLQYLDKKQNTFISAAKSQMPDLKVTNRCNVIFNGLSVVSKPARLTCSKICRV
jgi:hypothetical protein